jgi:hypothetical protein
MIHKSVLNIEETIYGWFNAPLPRNASNKKITFTLLRLIQHYGKDIIKRETVWRTAAECRQLAYTAHHNGKFVAMFYTRNNT